MRTLLLYLSLFFLSIVTVHAQSMKKMVQKTEFENRLAKEVSLSLTVIKGVCFK